MNSDDLLFERLATRCEEQGDACGPVPSVLKSRLFSSLVDSQQRQGPLVSLAECREAGASMCVFEHLVAIAPVGEQLKSRNPCNVCHARVLAERFEQAPIFWPGCPYVAFQNR